MALTVELRQRFAHASKKQPKGQCIELVVDDNDLLVHLLLKVRRKGQTPLLDRVDPYGDLVLSGDDMSQLVVELSRLTAAADSRDQELLVEAVERMAHQCAASPADFRLHFVGD